MMSTSSSSTIGTIGRCTTRTTRRLTRALPTCLRRLGLALVLSGLTLGLTAALPTAVEAVNTCNTFIATDYVSGPNFGVVGDTFRVKLSLFTGTVTGGTKVTVNRVRFDLDCTNATTGSITCTDLGAIISYTGDSTITTSCATAWTTTSGNNSTSPNQVVFTAGTPFDIPPSTGTAAAPFCDLQFDVKIASLPSPAQPSIAETAGFDQTLSDGSCDNGLKASGSVSSSINLCPTCTNEECNTVTCNADLGTCTIKTPSNEGGACTTASSPPNECQKEICVTGICTDVGDQAKNGNACTFGGTAPECQHNVCNTTDGTATCVPVADAGQNGATCTTASPEANACQKEICASGVCNSVSNPAANGQECNFGPTPGECQTDVCSNGACVLANANEGSTCTTASPGPNTCQREICQGGTCNSVSNPAVNGQACEFGPTPGECQADVCSNGACVLVNANEGGACTTASPPPTQCQEQVCQSGTCVDVNIEPPPDVCVPKKIPTLSEWGMIMLGGLLALIGFATIRRREM